MAEQLIYPMAAHVALAAFLYALLTVARAPAIWDLAHTGVHVLTRNVRLRGLVFTINFLAVLGMWASLAWG